VKPYAVGDRVNVDEQRYFVHQIQLFATTFRTLHNK
jgi:small-conductance mechanosensitive channel